MLKKPIALCLGMILCGVTASVRGADHTGELGLNYTVGPSFIAGGSHATDRGSVEPGVGAALQMGVLPNVDALFSYDYVDADLRTQAITFGGQYRFTPDRTWTPIAGVGLGFGKPVTGEGWDHFSLKLTGGLEKELTRDVSIAGTFSYQYVEGPDPFGSVHALEPGLRLIYYFGSVNPKRAG